MDDAVTSARPLSAKDWELQKEVIKDLYLVHENSLSTVMRIMQEQHDFSATPKQFKTYLKRWGMEKNMKLADMRHIVRIAKRRRVKENKETEFVVRNQPVPPHKVERWMRTMKQAKESQGDATSIVRPSTPPEIRYRTPAPDSPVAEDTSETWEGIWPRVEASLSLGSQASPPARMPVGRLSEMFWAGPWQSAGSHAAAIRRGDHPYNPQVAVNLAVMQDDLYDLSWAAPPVGIIDLDPAKLAQMVALGCHYPEMERLVGTAYIIDNIDMVSNKLLNYIDKNMSNEIINLVYNLDDLIWKTYLVAFRQIAEAPTHLERTLMVNVFRFCLGTLNSSKQVKVVIDTHFGLPTMQRTLSMAEIATSSRSDFLGQLRMTLCQKLMCPWSVAVLESLDTMMRSGRREYWFTTYLACFIMLHGAVLLDRADGELSRRAGPDNRPSHETEKYQHQGAMRVLLGFYHHSYDKFRPFEMALNRAADLAELAGLSDEQIEHVQWTAQAMKAREHLSAKSRQQEGYEDDYYWISQLFDPHWWQTCGLGLSKTLDER